jgi:hypothetical protein
MENQRMTLQDEAAAIRYKQKAHSDLIAALIQYRESSKVSGRPAMWAWAQIQLDRVVRWSHLNEDLKLVEAIVAYQATGIVPDGPTQDMLDSFKSLLSSEELKALTYVRTTIAAA